MYTPRYVAHPAERGDGLLFHSEKVRVRALCSSMRPLHVHARTCASRADPCMHAALFHPEQLHNVAPIEAGVRHALVVELWLGAENRTDRHS